MRQTLVVMLKDPRVGRVKTRLARDIGAVPATWWFRHQTWRLLQNLRDPRWDLVLAMAPDTAAATRAYPYNLPRIAQGTGDLGARMARQLTGPSPTLVIGGDVPGIRKAHIARAFHALASHDAVFGPATDGGYWLIGTRGRAAPPGFLQNVRWSTQHALADSAATLSTRRIAYTDTLQDVDTAADLPR